MSQVSTQSIQQKASEWLAYLYSGEASDESKREFETWILSDPAHAAEYRKMELAWRSIALYDEKTDVVKSKPVRAKRKGWVYTGIVLVATIVVALAVSFFYIPGPQNDIAGKKYRTVVAQVRDITLPDGSVVTLGAKSELIVFFGSQERRIELVDGEAFFAVKKDTGRPFIVTADDAQVTVIGTQFNVHRGLQKVKVAVLDGVVAVRLQTSSSTQAQIHAGEQVFASRTDGLSVIESVDIPPGSWRSGRLHFEGARLQDVIADAGRYFPGEIELESDRLKDIRITTAFRTNQVRQMLDSLAATHPIELVHTETGKIRLVEKGRE